MHASMLLPRWRETAVETPIQLDSMLTACGQMTPYGGLVTSDRRSQFSTAKIIVAIVSGYGLLPGRRQAIIWSNAGTLLIGPLRTKFSEILIEIQTFSLKRSSVKCLPCCIGLNVLRHHKVYIHAISTGIMLYMCPANEKWCYSTTTSLIG